MKEDDVLRMRLCAWGLLLFYTGVFAILIIKIGSLFPALNLNPSFGLNSNLSFNSSLEFFKFPQRPVPLPTVDQMLPTIWPIPMLLIAARKKTRVPLIFMYVGLWLAFSMGLMSGQMLRTPESLSSLPLLNAFVIYPILLGIESYILHKLLEPICCEIGSIMRRSLVTSSKKMQVGLQDEIQRLDLVIQKLDQKLEQAQFEPKQPYKEEYIETVLIRVYQFLLYPVALVTTKPGTTQRSSVLKFLEWLILFRVRQDLQICRYVTDVLLGFPFSLFAQGVLDQTIYLNILGSERVILFNKNLPLPYSKRLRLLRKEEQNMAVFDLSWFEEGAWKTIKYEVTGLSKLKGRRPIINITARIDKDKNIVIDSAPPLSSIRVH